MYWIVAERMDPLVNFGTTSPASFRSCRSSSICCVMRRLRSFSRALRSALYSAVRCRRLPLLRGGCTLIVVLCVSTVPLVVLTVLAVGEVGMMTWWVCAKCFRSGSALADMRSSSSSPDDESSASFICSSIEAVVVVVAVVVHECDDCARGWIR